nr:MAG TPA: hypothetical protein [Caudoviricetes sp.]
METKVEIGCSAMFRCVYGCSEQNMILLYWRKQ